MSAEIIPFSFESASSTIRVVEIDGEPWFVAKDVAEALDYAESTLSNIDKTIGNVPDEWKGRYPIPTLGGSQDLYILSESGLYFFVGRSDKPKALPFQKWLAGLSQNILLQQVRGICSILKVRMPEVTLLRQKPTQLDLEEVG